MKISKYQKQDDYSYALGAFPSMELIKNKSEYVKYVFIHSSFNNKDVIKEIESIVSKDKIIYDDKVFTRLSNKENYYVITLFNKYNQKLDSNKNHLLLDNPSNMGNLGTIIRSSLGFNITDIVVIIPGVDYFDPKVIRASMGSIFSVNIAYFSSLEEYKSNFPNHTIYSFMLQSSNSLDNYKFNTNKLSTLAFGNEASGLPLKYLNENSIIIKHSSKIDSLNITNAVTIALYEFNKQLINK